MFEIDKENLKEFYLTLKNKTEIETGETVASYTMNDVINFIQFKLMDTLEAKNFLVGLMDLLEIDYNNIIKFEEAGWI